MFVETMKKARCRMIDEDPQSIGEPLPSEADDGLETMVFELVEDAKSSVAGGCNRVLLDAPGTAAGQVQDAGLAGGWEIAIDEAGRFDITDVDASVEPLCVALHDPESGGLREIDTGRLSLSLTDAETLGIDEARLDHFAPLNRGRIDRFSGVVGLTWAVVADSDELAAAGIEPFAAIVPMIGCFDPETEALQLAGVGEVLDGPLSGAKLQITTKQKTTCRITITAPDPIPRKSGGTATANVKVKLKGTPKKPVTVKLSAFVTPKLSTKVSFNPPSVTLTKSGDSKPSTATISASRSAQLVRFKAKGGGKEAKTESVIG